MGIASAHPREHLGGAKVSVDNVIVTYLDNQDMLRSTRRWAAC